MPAAPDRFEPGGRLLGILGDAPDARCQVFRTEDNSFIGEFPAAACASWPRSQRLKVTTLHDLQPKLSESKALAEKGGRQASPDVSREAVWKGGELTVLAGAGTRTVLRFTPRCTDACGPIIAVAWSPDAESLAVALHGEPRILIVRVRDGAVQQELPLREPDAVVPGTLAWGSGGPVALLRRRYPKVQVVLHQGTPEQVARMLLSEVADIGLATESLSEVDDLVTLPCYEWQHALVVPRTHALATVDRPSLEQVAVEPLVTYHPTVSGRSRIDAAFAKARLKPQFALEALDSDVIKTYVRLGLGIGIVAEMAVRDDGSNSDLLVRPLGHLFGQNVARVAFKRSAYLRNFVFKFAELLSDRLDRNLIAKAMTGHVNDYEL